MQENRHLSEEREKQEDKQPYSRLLVRAITVMECIAQSDTPMGVRELSAKTKLPLATIHRIIHTMSRYDWLIQGEDAKFRIGMGAYAVGSKYDQIEELRKIAHYTMQKLSDELIQPVNLMVRDHNEVLIIDQTSCRKVYSTVSPIGSRRPMYLTGCGKAMMSEMLPTEMDLLLESFEYRPYTKYSPKNKAEVLEQLAEARRKGWALDNQEAVLGAFCVATGIHKEGRIIASISVTSVMANAHCIEHYAERVMEAAAEIEKNFERYLQEQKHIR